MKRWDVKLINGYLVQVYDLESAYLTYDMEGNIILITKNAYQLLSIVISGISQKNDDLIKSVTTKVLIKYGTTKDEGYVVLKHLIKCSEGVARFLGVTSGTKLSREDCEKLKLASARILGCSVIGVGGDGLNELVIMRKGKEERLGDLSSINKEQFINLYNLVTLAYEKVLGLPDMYASIGILIETLCAEAEVKGNVKYINHSNYFYTVDTNVDWIYDLESEYKKVERLAEPAECLLQYLKAVLYDEDYKGYMKRCHNTERLINRYGNKGVVAEIKEDSDMTNGVNGRLSLIRSAEGHSHLDKSGKSIEARVAWLKENYGENWKEKLGGSASEEEYTKLEENLNIILSTIVFDATKLIFSGRKPKCKENTMQSLYNEIFKCVLHTVTFTSSKEDTRKIITEELDKYFEPIPNDTPQFMNIFSNKGLAPDGGKWR